MSIPTYVPPALPASTDKTSRLPLGSVTTASSPAPVAVELSTLPTSPSLSPGEHKAEPGAPSTPTSSQSASVITNVEENEVGPPEEELQKFLDKTIELYEYEYVLMTRKLRSSQMMCHALSTAWKHQCEIVEGLRNLLNQHDIVIPPRLGYELPSPPSFPTSFATAVTAN